MTAPLRRGLPRALDAIAGLRGARWTRESMPGQYDSFGPEAQREQQDRAIGRYGLVDTGLEWTVAHSGRTVGSTVQFGEMLARAGTDYDVLVVGYVSRFAHDLRTAVNARHDLHASGAVILFADERLLSSDEEEWERWAREAVEAEAYSRRLGRRIGEGYSAKRRRLGIPGGNRPPLATRRAGRTMEIDEAGLAIVRAAYALSIAGATDREVAAATGLKLRHVSEILTNRFYRGELTDGSASVLGPLVDVEIWERVQVLRGRFARRHPGHPARHHPYPLAKILCCASCGRRLTGHVGRYRHVDACPEFIAARPRFTRVYSHALDRSVRGQSYPAEVYDGLVPQVLARLAVDAPLRVGAIAAATLPLTTAGDPLMLARIGREREAAMARYLRERDLRALNATMIRLDREEVEARGRTPSTPTAAEALAYLEDLPGLWARAEDSGRRAMAASLFERIDVLGTQEATVTPTLEAEALGLTAAWSGPLLCSIGSYCSRNPSRPDQNDPSGTEAVPPRRRHPSRGLAPWASGRTRSPTGPGLGSPRTSPRRSPAARHRPSPPREAGVTPGRSPPLPHSAS